MPTKTKTPFLLKKTVILKRNMINSADVTLVAGRSGTVIHQDGEDIELRFESACNWIRNYPLKCTVSDVDLYD